jgi:WD40 repeat protein
MVGLVVSPDGKRILASTVGDGTWLLGPDGGSPKKLEGIVESYGVAFNADGRLAAASGGVFGVEERVILVWDVESGQEVAVLEVGEMVRHGLQFSPDGNLLSASESGLLRWDVETGERELLYEGTIFRFAASSDGSRVLMIENEDASQDWGHAILLDLDAGTVTHLDQFGADVNNVALDPSGTLVATGDKDGEVRVGLLTGEEPHLFVGHEGSITSTSIDPLGRWVASGGADTTIRLWPMPDFSKPPLHTLPHEELIAKLKTLTNLRVVRDSESATGWKLTHDPFPGWETVPEW